LGIKLISIKGFLTVNSINGEKSFYTKFASMWISVLQGARDDRMTAFIVERAFGGVTNGSPEDKLGIRGSNST